MQKLAAVTGATGLIGREIVNGLLSMGIRVKLLTRKQSLDERPSVEIVRGDIRDNSVVQSLVKDADYLFHCAAELYDESKMWETNTEATKLLYSAAVGSKIQYVCHLSSVGVIGKLNVKVANETTPCMPLNEYEKSKLEAENLTRSILANKRHVILRPTNVIGRSKNNLNNMGKLKLILKGGENAHIVHARDVAAAALYFLNVPQAKKSECYIIGTDEEKMNTVSGCVAICDAIKNKVPLSNVKIAPHLPWHFMYAFRRILKGPCNKGDVLYSSEKLIASGFKYPLGFMGALMDVCENS